MSAGVDQPRDTSQRSWVYIANDSFSHRSGQVVGVTVSPYHWCAYSCSRSERNSVRSEISREPIVTSVWVSIAEPLGTRTAPSRSNG